MTRREFGAAVAALSAAWALDPFALGRAMAEPTTADPGNTLLRTVLQGPVQAGRYRTLTAGPGEPHVPRIDVLQRNPEAGRVTARRSLLYLAHLSDMHVIDAQSPGRIEPMIVLDHAAWASAFHPHDPLTVHVMASMVQAFADLRTSPVTGAPMGVAVVTGDSADMHSFRELRWYIDVLDGGSIHANSGAPDRFEGVQAWPEATWAYRPGDPSGGDFGAYGFPRLPDLLAQAIAKPVESVGLPVPWFAVYGNHDTLMMGTFDVSAAWRALAVGGRKSFSLEATASDALLGYAASGSPLQRWLDALGTQIGLRPGLHSVTPDADRRLFEQRDFMVEHFNTRPNPGPVGHGFTQHNLDSGETWWQADLSPQVRGFGLDTCNQVAGPDGAVPDDQFRWLEEQLTAAQAENKLVMIFSHHNSLTLENQAQRPGQTQVLHGAEEFVALLLRFSVVIGWLNGHTHLNQILPHRRADGGGFWEVTTASCIDFPQQQQTVEIVDNRDGTLSIFTTAVDHASPITPGGSGSAADLASQSRELAANDWAETPIMRRGSALDRNTELLLPAPFDLAAITDATLEQQRAGARARLLAWEQGGTR